MGYLASTPKSMAKAEPDASPWYWRLLVPVVWSKYSIAREGIVDIIVPASKRKSIVICLLGQVRYSPPRNEEYEQCPNVKGKEQLILGNPALFVRVLLKRPALILLVPWSNLSATPQ